MKTLVAFDSYFGNTEQIGQSIANAFASTEFVEIKRCKEVQPDELQNYDLLILGSPTRGFRPTDNAVKLIKEIPKGSLKSCKIVTFDTRITLETINSKLFRKVVHKGGYAAKPLAERLKKKGGQLLMEPEGFYVLDTEGPLKDGEIERAENWGKRILKKYEDK